MPRSQPSATLAVLFASALNVSGLYFPMPVVNLSLPDVNDVPKPLPPLLKLHALETGEGQVEYYLNPWRNSSFFSIRKNELFLREDRIPTLKNGHYEIEITARSETEGTDSIIINLFFTPNKLICENWKKEMCFWTDGKIKVLKHEEPEMVYFLSSEFLLSFCSNYSITYRPIAGEKYLKIGRRANTNAGSWALSLISPSDLDKEKSVRGEVECSISTENGSSAVYRKEFNLEFFGKYQPRSPKKHFQSLSSLPKHLDTMSLILKEEKQRSKIVLTYPRKVNISRFAGIATRVMEPSPEISGSSNGMENPKTRADGIKLILDEGIKFDMEPNEAFRVTKLGGIVYVLDSTYLRNYTSLSVKIVWTYPNGRVSSSVTEINIYDIVGIVCGGKESETRNRKSCSQKTSEKECIKTCGISTGSLKRNGNDTVTTFGCQWRDNDKPEMLSVSYKTCSPDLRNCPDRLCDPLERIFPDICPQDCAEYVYGSANKEISMPGISSASGVCSCNSEDGRQSCTCGLLSSNKRQGKGRKFHKVDKTTELPLERHGDVNVSVVQAVHTEQCGMACLSSILGGFTFLIFFISLFLTILYHRRLKKRCLNQGPLKEDMININYEEYIDRTAETIRVPSHNSVLQDKPDYYDKKWEFPRYRLTVEETLGEGEFGKVLKAKAEGIGGIEGSITVAVKTLKENAKESELTDLISEYQLLKEVDHPNIIHLLGACTTLDGPLYIIIEYAKHGSLRNYLRRNRHFGSELQLNEKEVETSYIQSITPKDILTFAWQIAKGMAYLTEMKLVHRDLAARNVLVADGLICKISDFGLTRDIYEDDTYLKRSKGRVPVKWMALESLSDHIYTTKSDIWSYGIVLWELVTTGASPYPGIAVQNLFHLLKSGYRMEKPVNCSPELYQILRSCWHENPSHRPTFKSLVSKLEEMLGEGKDYLDLNPRIIENKTYFTKLRNWGSTEDNQFFFRGPENKIFNWKFDSSEVCGCPPGECSCRNTPRYENQNVTEKLRYENEKVEDSSLVYVRPRGDPKPVNSEPSDNFSTLNSDDESNEIKL